MKPSEFTLGFRVVGSKHEARRLVRHVVAFDACAECDPRAELDRESYLSAFTFNDELRAWFAIHNSPKGFTGNCWSRWLWLDLDRDDIDHAVNDARKIAAYVVDRWRIDGDDLLLFFSGKKGFHLGLPLSLCGPVAPSTTFNAHCRRLAERLAAGAGGVVIDSTIFDRQRIFRAPNSTHPATRLRKRKVEFDELLKSKPSAIVEAATKPRPFEIPPLPAATSQAVADWDAAGEDLRRQAASLADRQARNSTGGKLNRATLEFIRAGAHQGQRHNALFSAAANLAEAGVSLETARELLTESALDSGLPPAEVRRVIENGIKHFHSQGKTS